MADERQIVTLHRTIGHHMMDRILTDLETTLADAGATGVRVETRSGDLVVMAEIPTTLP